MGAVRFLLSPNGRASRKGMLAVTLLFLVVGAIRAQMTAQGAVMLAGAALVLQCILIWPAQIAVPIRRFHDMDRRGFWVAVFWGAALVGLGFTHWGMGQTGALVDMTAMSIWSSPTEYVAAIDGLNSARAADDQIKLLNGAGMGGISLAMIFLIIQFGWLHLIPGRPGANQFGPSPLAQAGPGNNE